MNASHYRTLDGDDIDLGVLTEPEQSFLEECRARFVDELTTYMEFDNFTRSAENPAMDAFPWISRRYTNSPLGKILWDLSDRLGIRQGKVGAEPGDDAWADPFGDHQPLATSRAS